MTIAYNLDPDEAQQNVGPHLRSKLFDTQIIFQQNFGWKQRIFANFERKRTMEKLIDMQRVRNNAY